MIRRFYVLPLNPGVSQADLDAFLKVLDASDRFIPGLLASAAGLDFDSRTIIWENIFVDAESYAGSYMVHPYHIGALDDYVMADSPQCLTHDIYTTRYTLPDAMPQVQSGVRRLVLMNLAEGTDLTTIAELAMQPDGMASSLLHADDVPWVSPKGRPWTHIWEQGFSGRDVLERYLQTPHGINCSSLEGLRRQGVGIDALRIFAYPLMLKPPPSPAPPPPDDGPIAYTITARTAVEDADAYLALLESCYDPYLLDAGGKLLQRWRTIDQAYLQTEVQSTWEMASLQAYAEARLATAIDPRWKIFVRDAMPLVKGGTRRFYRPA